MPDLSPSQSHLGQMTSFLCSSDSASIKGGITIQGVTIGPSRCSVDTTDYNHMGWRKSDPSRQDRVRFQKAGVPGKTEVSFLLNMPSVTALPLSLLGASL